MTDKRPAYEPAVKLLAPTRYDPGMKRPLATTVGAALVLLRVSAGIVWLSSLALQWPEIIKEADVAIDGIAIDPTTSGVTLALLLGGGALVLAVEALLAVLIFRGLNWPRVVVMLYAVVSISTAFVAWWVQGLDIEIQTTLLTLALDILVLLALSSRDASAYARRNERR